ncbi:hypothetical protein [Amycolatopsis sp. cmx-11-51]|uniref:hypothetical protein n=1 Tax=Amycolatopsis sp. cmx-11-51 TaxID=2785797 RepID=UPI0039E5D17E
MGDVLCAGEDVQRAIAPEPPSHRVSLELLAGTPVVLVFVGVEGQQESERGAAVVAVELPRIALPELGPATELAAERDCGPVVASITILVEEAIFVDEREQGFDLAGDLPHIWVLNNLALGSVQGTSNIRAADFEYRHKHLSVSTVDFGEISYYLTAYWLSALSAAALRPLTDGASSGTR